MIIAKNPKKLSQILLNQTTEIGFVPTMGALHEGHMSLVRKAKEENQLVVVSIFLNPTQFDQSSDLDGYPSSIEKDIELLKNEGVDILFTPTFDDIYPDSFTFKMVETNLSNKLCGSHRPGHFDGVLTVVLKLFNIVKPKRAYFGEKDFQQLVLIKNMVEALFLDIEIVACPIVRESSGLAMSSRNRKLNPESFEAASNIHRIIKSKEPSTNIKSKLEQLGLAVEYLEDIDSRRFVAAKINNVRLIDNVSI
ncbi:MAG: pantoate--beta-alanine ligase [Bdellovibrionales bacterium]